MSFKTIVAFLVAAISVNASSIPHKRAPLTFGPFTPEQWSDYTQLISHVEASGAMAFNPNASPSRSVFFTSEQLSEFNQRTSIVKALGVIKTKRDQNSEPLREFTQQLSSMLSSQGLIPSKHDPLTLGPFTDFAGAVA
ncbi:hypothetical protein BJ322DRAFT_1093990 [Thelephora terrestris]|uniref:Uncharacterized protein n=1 Tax=Thelephora terrestris TaxID=56493 RepID=A0A9P6L1N3_9AGAM|nr:hypothetical protein BJ322DRAFT_1093990 [Thelephora terrestris]